MIPTQIPFWRRAAQTRTDVNDEASLAASNARGYRNAYRTAATVLASTQYWLWALRVLYGQAGRASWLAAAMLLLPLAVLWLVWCVGGRSNVARALLLPCLLWDACAALLAVRDACAVSLLPGWSGALVAALAALMAWLCVARCGRHGVVLGLRQTAWLLAVLAAAFLGAQPTANHLYPLLGKGFAPTAEAALGASGSCWTVALLFVLPGEARPESERGFGRAVRATWIWALAGFAIGAFMALWLSLCLPWQAQGEQALLALTWLCGSPIFQQVTVLALLALSLATLAGCAFYGETVARAALPKLPRSLAAAIVAAVALAAALLPSEAPLHAVAPYRWALALLAGGVAILQGRSAR